MVIYYNVRIHRIQNIFYLLITIFVGIALNGLSILSKLLLKAVRYLYIQSYIRQPSDIYNRIQWFGAILLNRRTQVEVKQYEFISILVVAVSFVAAILALNCLLTNRYVVSACELCKWYKSLIS